MDITILNIRFPDNAPDRFLVALLELLKKKKYDDISITEICKEAKLSRKTFYVHFTQKDDLLSHLSNDLCLGFSQTDDRSGFYHFFAFWYHLQDWVAVLIDSGLFQLITMQSIYKYNELLYPKDWSSLLGEHLKERSLIFEFVCASLTRLVEKWHENNFKESPEEMAALAEFILSGTLQT